MSEFKEYVCWRPDVVTATIKTEAISPSDAVFRATHAPLRIRRSVRAVASRSGKGAYLTEEQLLRDFLDTPVKEGVLVAPVLGESGSGKSHLIRWVHSHIDPSVYHVIYLPKVQTSLRDVVTILLANQQGPQFDRIRSQVDRLGETVDQVGLEHRILNELAEALRQAVHDDAYTKALVGDNGFFVLLHDPVFREYMLRPGAFIERRADHAMHGRGDDDVPLEFTVADLPLDIDNVEKLNLGDATRVAQNVFRRLASNEAMQRAAVRLLNENLDVAVTRAAYLGVGDVKRAFLDLREALLGREIILLVEDFALIQGVQRDLLDAIVEAGVVKGVQKYAIVRTLMAVTSGYYLQLDPTFRTRAEASSPVYKLDMRMTGDGAVTLQETVDFVARYLNVARLGEDQIEQNGVVANACDKCPFRDPCLAVFGSSRDGYGLYPYNRDALAAAVQASATEDNPTSFSPRGVLAKAVRQVLISQADEIRDGHFPGSSFSEILPMRPSMKDLEIRDRRELESQFSGDDLTRYRNLLVFWCGARGLENPGPGVLTAFDMAPLLEGRVRPHPTPGSTPTGASAATAVPTPSAVPASLVKAHDSIAAWLKGAPMPQDTARTIRNTILAAIEERCDWTSPPVNGDSRLLADFFKWARRRTGHYVSIEGASENIQPTEPPPITLPRTGENAQFFQDLLSADQGLFTGTRQSLAHLESIAETWFQVFENLAIARAQFDDKSLAAAIRTQIDGAALCGMLESPQSKAVEAVFWDGTRPTPREDLPTRIDQWARMEAVYLKERLEMTRTLTEALGVAQGTGGVHAIDIERVRSLMRIALDRTQDLQHPAWADRCEQARRQLAALVPHQLQRWSELVSRVRQYVPEGTQFKETLRSLDLAANEGAPHGLVLENMDEISRRNDSARGLDFDSVLKIERLVSQAKSAGADDQARLIGTDVGLDAARIDEFLVWSSRWVERGLSPRGHSQSSELDLDQAIRRTVDNWLTIVTEVGHVTAAGS